MKGNELHKIMRSDFAGTIFAPLLELTDCPRYMYYQGLLPNVSIKLITIVGSRTHSRYAQQALEYLVRSLPTDKICIVSGLALGIDALAHRLALDNGIPTIAIPGSGLNHSVLYPATNRGLADSIIQNEGCLVAEFEPESRAARWTFPKRNRIMAALSDLVLVVEAAEKSGTLITARNALEYNTEVAVIPGSILNEQAHGSNELLRNGAQLVTSANDILHLLGIDHASTEEKTYDDLGKEEQIIMNFLIEPKTKQDIVESLGINIARCNSLISLLEIKGYVKEEFSLIIKKVITG